MYKWKDVTEYFSEDARHYKETYLEIDEVLNEEVEVSLSRNTIFACRPMCYSTCRDCLTFNPAATTKSR